MRTLAGNFQLFQLAPWTLTPRNRVLFQLVSHKVMRLVVPYLLVLLLVSSLALSPGSRVCAAFAALQIFGWVLAIAGLRSGIPLFNRIASPATALFVLKAAAVIGLYRFLFTRGPLWKIWNSSPPEAMRPAPETVCSAPQEIVAVTAPVDIDNCSFNDLHDLEERRIL